MAQTDAGKKKVYVHEHKKSDGTIVPTHYRSAECPWASAESSADCENDWFPS